MGPPVWEHNTVPMQVPGQEAGMDIHKLLRHRCVGDGVGHTRTMLWSLLCGSTILCLCKSQVKKRAWTYTSCLIPRTDAGISRMRLMATWIKSH